MSTGGAVIGKPTVIGLATVDFLAVELPSLPRSGGDEFSEETLVLLTHKLHGA